MFISSITSDYILMLYLFCSAPRSNPGPAVIKLFESEIELKCKNRFRDFIETLCLISNI